MRSNRCGVSRFIGKKLAETYMMTEHLENSHFKTVDFDEMKI